MPKNNWKKELAKLMGKYTLKNGDWNIVDGFIPLESFISNLLAQQRKDFIKDLEGLKMKEEKPYYKWGIGAKFKKIVYKQAVKEINQKITNLKEKYEEED